MAVTQTDAGQATMVGYATVSGRAITISRQAP